MHQQVIEFLNHLEATAEIEDFKAKVGKDGYLRVATLSHLRTTFKLERKEAEIVLDHWMFDI